MRRVIPRQNFLGGVEQKPDWTTDFWKAFYQRPSPAQFPLHLGPEEPPVGDALLAPAAEDGVTAAICASKANTAPGLNGCKRADMEALDKLWRFMNAA